MYVIILYIIAHNISVIIEYNHAMVNGFIRNSILECNTDYVLSIRKCFKRRFWAKENFLYQKIDAVVDVCIFFSYSRFRDRFTRFRFNRMPDLVLKFWYSFFTLKAKGFSRSKDNYSQIIKQKKKIKIFIVSDCTPIPWYLLFNIF